VRARGEYRFCRVKDSIEPEALRAGGRWRERAMGEYKFCRVKDSIEPDAPRAGGREGRQGGSIGL
jgi:hypothetical protein